MNRELGPGEGQGGFAAVDALVAVTILSFSLALSLMAAQVGTRASRAAGETRQAEVLLRTHLEATGGRSGVWGGRDGNLDWRVEAHRSDAERNGRAAPCVRTALARAADGRTYQMSTVDICRPEAVG